MPTDPCVKNNQNSPQYIFSGSINLIVGGWDRFINPFSDARIVNLANENSTCNIFPNYPIAMSGATGAIVDGHPIICGGLSEGGNVHSECYHQNKANNSWTLLTKMSTKRAGSASVPVKGKLLVLGGHDDAKFLADVRSVCLFELSHRQGDVTQIRLWLA